MLAIEGLAVRCRLSHLTLPPTLFARWTSGVSERTTNGWPRSTMRRGGVLVLLNGADRHTRVAIARGLALRGRRWRLGLTLSDVSTLLGAALPHVSEVELGFGSLDAARRTALRDCVDGLLCS